MIVFECVCDHLWYPSECVALYLWGKSVALTAQAEFKDPLLCPRAQVSLQFSGHINLRVSARSLRVVSQPQAPGSQPTQIFLFPPMVSTLSSPGFSPSLAQEGPFPSLNMVTAAPCRSQMAPGKAGQRLPVLSDSSLIIRETGRITYPYPPQPLSSKEDPDSMPKLRGAFGDSGELHHVLNLSI